jgi:hypothetical protein
MGHHYLPRRLLRGFSQEERVWTFDKLSNQQPKHLPIARVAQEPRMYSQEIEDRLGNEIEQPFNAVLDRIDDGESIGAQDTAAIARYALAMYRRVPAGRSRSKLAVPEVAAQVERDHLQRIDLLEQLSPGEHGLAESGRANVSAIFKKIRSENTDWLWQRTLLPESMPRAAAALQRMTWELWRVPRGHQLLIGDTPLIFDDAIGIANERAELILPVRSDTALVATWRFSHQGRKREFSMQQMRHINSQIATRAGRWIFFQRNEGWVLPFVRKRQNPGGSQGPNSEPVAAGF